MDRKMGYVDVMKLYEEASKRFHGTIAYKEKTGWIESLQKIKMEAIERILKELKTIRLDGQEY